MAISLGRRSPAASSDLPGSRWRAGPTRVPGPPVGDRGAAPLFGLAPDGVYRARPVARPAGELLPHRFTLTSRRGRRGGGLFSVALSLPSTGGGRYPPSRPAESGLSSPTTRPPSEDDDRVRSGHPARPGH